MNTTALMTVEEFASLPEKPGVRQELHHGEIFELPPPKKRHWKIQKRLVSLLTDLDKLGEVGVEFPFAALSEYELRVADVAFVSAERYEKVPLDGYLSGSPELVIEVESPSNTAAEFEDRESVCMASGCQEFWIVYPRLKRISVTTAQGTRKYAIDETIQLSVADLRVEVRKVFE